MTLLEVMVALLVISLALAGSISIVGAFALNHRHLTDKTMAQWVALNRMAESRLGLLPGETAVHQGTEVMGERNWPWTMTVLAGNRPEQQRIVVEVARPEDPGEVVYRLSTHRFVSN
jgi:type II secretion system protein I